MQKTFLCDTIKRVSTSTISGVLVNFTGITPMPDITKAFFSEKVNKTAAGTIAQQELELRGLFTTEQVTELITVPQIFELRFSNGTIHQWGDLNRPVVGTSGVKREGNQTSIVFERFSPVIQF